jgi:hypothetical protein
MNYLKTYCSLIRKAENRDCPEGYVEKHHIFPKSIFGNNNRVVVLTAREHYIAHALLEKVYMSRYGIDDNRTKKMTYAHFCMKRGNNRYHNSYLYEKCRERRSIILREDMLGYNHAEKTKTKIKNSNTGKIFSQERKDKISAAAKGRIPWNKGKTGVYNKETLQKMSENRKGKGLKEFTDEHKQKISKSLSGEKNGMYGKKHTQEYIDFMKEKMSGNSNPFYGKKHTEETKRKIRESKMKGKIDIINKENDSQ